MFNSQEYGEFLLNNLTPWAKYASGKREIVTRCKYCSDSNNMKHGHMYISIPRDDEPSMFNCVKCHTSGIVTTDRLMEWGIQDTNFLSGVSGYNKRIKKILKNYRFYDSEKIYQLKNTNISQDKLSQYKLNYINNRIGSNLTFNDLTRLKIILNLKDLLKENCINKLTRQPMIVDQLDTNFVGFISFDSAFVNLRNVNVTKVYNTIDKRYVNYNIFDKIDNTCRFYTIPCNINLLKPIELHLAEGSFDILSIYLNLRKNERENNIFTSIGGSGYKGIISFFLIKNMIPLSAIHIYADKDINRYKIQDVINHFRVFGIPIYIQRNNYPGEKDFGVPIERINEIIER